ncbi:MAG: amidohydrolase family protein [Gemmatimonadetes bacterium]|nr:amidohydrolase family protein [Gemmatimonadota bacterium]
MRLRHARAVLLAFTLCGVCQAARLPAQGPLVITNARVVTLDSAHPDAGAIAFAGGRIAALGDSALARRATSRVIDAHGATVVPAFTDHHAHLLNIGLWLLNDARREQLFVDVSTVRSLDELAQRLRDRARLTPAGGWVLGAGWSQASWGTQALPAADVLTNAVPDHPVFLARTDGHAGWANAAALGLAGIRGSTGLLLEGANDALTARIPSLPDRDIRRAFRLAAEALAARGVVEVYDAGALAFPGVVGLNADHARFVRLLRTEDAARPLPLRVNLMVPAPSALADSLLRHPGNRRLSPRIRITHLKLFADGALGSRGAALTHPYADDSTTRGVARMTAAEIGALALRAVDAGLGVATHAIGDEAVKRALDAYDAVIAARPAVAHGRLRIEHFSYARDEDFARAARLGVALSIQSNFNSAVEDAPPFGAMRVGAAAEPRVYAWDRLHRLGALLVEGSDYFARPLEPLAGFAAALTRRNAIGPSRADADARLRALAMQAARLTPNGERLDPALRVGAPADVVLLSDNPLTAPRESLAGVTVRMTLAGGRDTHAAPPRVRAP